MMHKRNAELVAEIDALLAGRDSRDVKAVVRALRNCFDRYELTIPCRNGADMIESLLAALTSCRAALQEAAPVPPVRITGQRTIIHVACGQCGQSMTGEYPLEHLCMYDAALQSGEGK